MRRALVGLGGKGNLQVWIESGGEFGFLFLVVGFERWF